MGVKSLVSLAAVAMLVMAGPSIAESEKGQGQGQAKAQSGTPPVPQARAHDDHAHAGSDQKMTHGQVVSECNHRANERKLKDKDRKHFVEWCTERGEQYRFDDRRYSYDRDCYERADGKGLSGTARMVFVADCTAKRDRDYEREREQDRDGKVRGLDQPSTQKN
jgi:hypothetical protein